MKINNNQFKKNDSNYIEVEYISADKTAIDVANHFDLLKYDRWEFVNNEKINKEEISLMRELLRKLSEIINANIMQRNTGISMSSKFIENSFMNAGIISNRIKLKDFEGALNNKPALIVSAGPSLDKQLKTLKKYQDYFYIIAVDKSYPSLAKYDIIPDFIITIDSESTPSWNQDGLNNRTIFINDIGSNPEITKSNTKNHLFISSNQDFSRIMDFFGIKSDILETGGSVATSAFSFAYITGANPIIFIGQDLAFTNNKDHANDYINPFEDALVQEKLKNGYIVEDYYGSSIITDKQFLTYKYWFELKIASIKDRLIVNCTEGGAKINGATQLSFSTICNEIAATIPTKRSLISNEIQTRIDTKAIELVIGKIQLALAEIKNIDALIESTLKKIKNNKIPEKSIMIAASAAKEMRNNNPELLSLISKFNQIEFYSMNTELKRVEHKSIEDLKLKYIDFFKKTSKSIELTTLFLNDILEAYNNKGLS